MSQRPKPQLLAAKLRVIRQTHGLSQSQLADILKVKAARVSEFELGRRLPNLLLLVSYSRIGDIPMEFLVIDKIELPYFTEYVGARHRGERGTPITLFWREA